MFKPYVTCLSLVFFIQINTNDLCFFYNDFDFNFKHPDWVHTFSIFAMCNINQANILNCYNVWSLLSDDPGNYEVKSRYRSYHRLCTSNTSMKKGIIAWYETASVIAWRYQQP